MKPEEKAREKIDDMLDKSGWIIQDYEKMNLSMSIDSGIAVREFPFSNGATDYALFIDEDPIGVIEAKKTGYTLSGVTDQSDNYIKYLHEKYTKIPQRPPFSYETTGIETQFTNRNDPDHRSRNVFTFHQPDQLREWLDDDKTLRQRLKDIPTLDYTDLRNCQKEAIIGLEKSFLANRPRALIQMASGAGKTVTAITTCYRLIKFAKAKRILFLVDRANLGRQALRDFQQYKAPQDGNKFTDLYNIQHLQSNTIDNDASVVISTIQRIYSILKGEQLDIEDEDTSEFEKEHDDIPVDIQYNKEIPIETFDFIIIDECHRSIYNKWRQILDYFDAFLIGLTATPSKNTIGFFNNNMVIEYTHQRAVADAVNVGCDVYRIKTKISEHGSKVDKGEFVEIRDKMTRKARYEKLDNDITYTPQDLDRSILAPDQIRTIIRAFKESLHEIFPYRTIVPKTLIYAKDDNHAEEITKITRDVFGKGNEFCKKITYKTTGEKPEDLIKSFRNEINPRIAVSVDMISTGTDIRPLECIVFMRDVKSKNYFDQMKGRGTRVIKSEELIEVTHDAKSKDHFVIVDAVGVCEHDVLSDIYPLNRRINVSFEKLLEKVKDNRADEDDLLSIASRLNRLNTNITDEDKKRIFDTNKITISEIVHKIYDSTDPDKQIERAKEQFKTNNPTSEQIDIAIQESIKDACRIFHSPELREIILDVKNRKDIIIDIPSIDQIISREFTETQAKQTIELFKKFIEENKDKLTALNIIYSKPYSMRNITFDDITELENAIKIPPYNLTPAKLWDAYQRLDKDKVKHNPQKTSADLVSIIRYSIDKQDMLSPYRELIDQKFEKWLLNQEKIGKVFNSEQRNWLVQLKEHIAESIEITKDDMELGPFIGMGGLVKFSNMFGSDYEYIMKDLNNALAVK